MARKKKLTPEEQAGVDWIREQRRRHDERRERWNQMYEELELTRAALALALAALRGKAAQGWGDQLAIEQLRSITGPITYSN